MRGALMRWWTLPNGRRAQDAWQPPERSADPVEEIYRRNVGQLADGGCLELATAYHRVARMLPREQPLGTKHQPRTTRHSGKDGA